MKFENETPPVALSPEGLPPELGKIAGTIHRALAAAGIKTPPEPVQAVVGKIRQSLAGSGIQQRSTLATGRSSPVPPPFVQTPITTPPLARSQPVRPGAPVPTLPGAFTSHSFTSPAGTLTYKLYVPASYSPQGRERVPLIVMLHGCTQSPDDFAAGTRMNQLAEERGFLVVYPAQSASANGSKCWNWFRPADQGRDRGEPALIAGLTVEVASHYRIDAQRIFVAGLSAGAAMAVVLGATYPELYAAVGAHSGLAYGAAHDTSSAFSVMHTGSPAHTTQAPSSSTLACTLPTIVFHGDRDSTVNVRNGLDIVEQITRKAANPARLRISTEQGVAPSGATFTRTAYLDGDHALAEYWLLHGAGHAWSGGSAQGSYTDPRGPDASSEMVRFFYAQQPSRPV